MQIKKEDIKQNIVDTALNEFLKKGYDDASMRTIAKKANTTVGNIYHYFPSKEAILDEILEPAILDLDKMIEEHLSLKIKINDVNEILDILDNDKLEDYQLHQILKKEFIILFEIKEGKYADYRDFWMDKFQQHVAWHLNVEDKNDYFVQIITRAVIECIITVVKSNSNFAQAKKDFTRFFKMICTGIVVGSTK